MIIFKSPLRVSFTGGGTDLNYFFEKTDGHVLSASINKHVYICLNKKFDEGYRISCSKLENVKRLHQIKHKLVKNVLNYYKIKENLEIVSIADVPGNGTGLGSSSAFCCSLLAAVNYHLNSKFLEPTQIAEAAYNLEKGKYSNECGKQDQYSSSHGGLNYFIFKKKNTVEVNKIKLSPFLKKNLEDNLMLIYTGMIHNSTKNLIEQKKNYNKAKFKVLMQLSELSRILYKNFSRGKLDDFGKILSESWSLKRQLSNSISNYKIDQIYNEVLNLGAEGGKLLGSGGGGFLLFYVKKNKKKKIKEKFKKYKILDFEIEQNGTSMLNN